ncbi:uncharacterized protein LOC118370161 isoform X1 [Oncorhynchus keta]|uniref:uncharacterized protein LOC118370161 isoform X1 n=1 Tax=Oncorhynchus keta TaxID=8018 RepID=UPI00227B3EF1|nr:uncharacterized protein LOC118370161 isoform X1 [Oncorhynchus keta]
MEESVLAITLATVLQAGRACYAKSSITSSSCVSLFSIPALTSQHMTLKNDSGVMRGTEALNSLYSEVTHFVNRSVFMGADVSTLMSVPAGKDIQGSCVPIRSSTVLQLRH